MLKRMENFAGMHRKFCYLPINRSFFENCINENYQQNYRRMRKNAVSQFIETIWEIVSDSNSDVIIRWSSHGTSFSILDTDLFAKEIIPQHFNHSNLSSFIRQLNMYNFHKKKTDKVGLEFHHKLFRRDARQLLIGIKRKPSEADAREGDELLKSFLQRTDAYKIDEKSVLSIDDRKQQSNNLTEPSKLGILNDPFKRFFQPKIIRNVQNIIKPQIILIEPLN